MEIITFAPVMNEVHKEYSDIFLRENTNQEKICEDMVYCHTLAYIRSGEMVMRKGGRMMTLKKGDTALVRRSHQVKVYKQPTRQGEPFNGLFVRLDIDFLKNIAQHGTLPRPQGAPVAGKTMAIRLPNDAELMGLMETLDRYYSVELLPSQAFVASKVEGFVRSLVERNTDLVSVLFDCMDPWKPSVEEFMNENFTVDFTTEEFAHFTARSVDDFKSDFSSIYQKAPSRWLLHRRLDEAYRLLQEKEMSLTEIFTSLAFKNQSYFSASFKRQFGFSPSEV